MTKEARRAYATRKATAEIAAGIFIALLGEDTQKALDFNKEVVRDMADQEYEFYITAIERLKV